MENNLGVNKNDALETQDDENITIGASSEGNSDSINDKDTTTQIAGEEVITESMEDGQPTVKSNVNETVTDPTTEDPVSETVESKSANGKGHTSNVGSVAGTTQSGSHVNETIVDPAVNPTIDKVDAPSPDTNAGEDRGVDPNLNTGQPTTIIQESRAVMSGVLADGEAKTTIIPETAHQLPVDVNPNGGCHVQNGVPVWVNRGVNVLPTQNAMNQYPVVPPAPPVIPPQSVSQNGWSGDDPNNGVSMRSQGMPKWAVGLISAGAAVVLSLGIGFGALSAGWVKIPGDAVGSSVSSIGKSDNGKTINATGVNSWAEVASKVSNSVVSIQAGSDNQEATGSGAVLDSEGHIVTNNHVVAGAKSIMVTMSDGQIIEASIVGTDPSTDLAVVKLKSLPEDGVNSIRFADSNNLVVGQGVMSIGSPLGYANTVTTGVISATDRPVVIATQGASNGYSATDAIQIDAAINPGNSGGPTFDSNGRVIGINSSIASTSTNQSEAGNVGIGFAIPSNLVKSITSSIIKDGEAKHVWLGVSMSGQDATVTVDDVTRSGAQIVKITSGSPAEKAGVQAGDVIIGWNGEPVENSSSLMSRVRSVALGEDVDLTVVRNGKLMDLEVTFDQVDPNNTTSTDNSSSGSGKNNSDSGDDSRSEKNGNSGSDDSMSMNDLEELLEQFGFSR